MFKTVILDQQQRLHDLLIRNQAGMLTDAEREQLAFLQQHADLVTLRKARAAVLPRFCGKRGLTLAELSQLAALDKYKVPITVGRHSKEAALSMACGGGAPERYGLTLLVTVSTLIFAIPTFRPALHLPT